MNLRQLGIVLKVRGRHSTGATVAENLWASCSYLKVGVTESGRQGRIATLAWGVKLCNLRAALILVQMSTELVDACSRVAKGARKCGALEETENRSH